MSGASAQTGAVDSVFLLIMGISVFFLVLITVLLVYFIIKYNKNRHKTPKNIRGNVTLEVLWIVIPTILVMIMFYFGWKGFQFIRNAPEDSMQVKVIARMWSWMFEYENGATSDVLRVPVNKPVKLLLQSQDVIHSFFIPAFRIKEDAVPGMKTTLWFEARETGKYDVLCAEYCGLRHAYMLSEVDVLPEEEFRKWYASLSPGKQDSTVVSEKNIETSGRKLLAEYGCVECHSTDGSRLVGPTFKGIFGRQEIVLINGHEKEIEVDEEYLRNSILTPDAAIVKGYDDLMPPQGEDMSEEELVILVQYLKGLK